MEYRGRGGGGLPGGFETPGSGGPGSLPPVAGLRRTGMNAAKRPGLGNSRRPAGRHQKPAPVGLREPVARSTGGDAENSLTVPVTRKQGAIIRFRASRPRSATSPHFPASGRRALQPARSPSPEVGRDADAKRRQGGERQSRTAGARLRPSPPGRFATTLPMKGRENRGPTRNAKTLGRNPASCQRPFATPPNSRNKNAENQRPDARLHRLDLWGSRL